MSEKTSNTTRHRLRLINPSQPVQHQPLHQIPLINRQEMRPTIQNHKTRSRIEFQKTKRIPIPNNIIMPSSKYKSWPIKPCLAARFEQRQRVAFRIITDRF